MLMCLYLFRLCRDGRVSESTVCLIRKLLVLDPQQRLTATEVLESLSAIIASWCVPSLMWTKIDFIVPFLAETSCQCSHNFLGIHVIRWCHFRSAMLSRHIFAIQCSFLSVMHLNIPWTLIWKFRFVIDWFCFCFFLFFKQAVCVLTEWPSTSGARHRWSA